MVRSLTVIALVAVIGGIAAADTYKVTGENTKLTFIGTKSNGKHEGGFKSITGTATVTGTDLTSLKLDVTIDTDSVWSDDEKLTGHLKSPDFFSVKDNPKATFKSTKVEKTAKGYDVTGDLTLLGKTKSVTMPATITSAGDLKMTTEFAIDRNDWGMSYGKGKIDDKVKLKIVVDAKK